MSTVETTQDRPRGAPRARARPVGRSLRPGLRRREEGLQRRRRPASRGRRPRRRRGRRDQLRRLRPAPSDPSRRPRRRPPRCRFQCLRRCPRDRLPGPALDDCRPRGRHRTGRCRLHVGRRRPRHRSVRDGDAVGFRVHDRGRRPDPRWRHRLSHPALRPDGGQPALRRRGARRRQLRHRERRPPPRPVLGAAGWRRQLRRGHVVHLRLPPGGGGRCRPADPCSTTSPTPRRSSGGTATWSRSAGRAQRLDRCHGGPVRSALPRGDVGPQGVRDRVVLLRTARPGGRGAGARASSGHRC